MEAALEANLTLQSRLRSSLAAVDARLAAIEQRREAALDHVIRVAEYGRGTSTTPAADATADETADETATTSGAAEYVATIDRLTEKLSKRKWTAAE